MGSFNNNNFGRSSTVGNGNAYEFKVDNPLDHPHPPLPGSSRGSAEYFWSPSASASMSRPTMEARPMHRMPSRHSDDQSPGRAMIPEWKPFYPIKNRSRESVASKHKQEEGLQETEPRLENEYLGVVMNSPSKDTSQDTKFSSKKRPSDDEDDRQPAKRHAGNSYRRNDAVSQQSMFGGSSVPVTAQTVASTTDSVISHGSDSVTLAEESPVHSAEDSEDSEEIDIIDPVDKTQHAHTRLEDRFANHLIDNELFFKRMQDRFSKQFDDLNREVIAALQNRVVEHTTQITGLQSATLKNAENIDEAIYQLEEAKYHADQTSNMISQFQLQVRNYPYETAQVRQQVTESKNQAAGALRACFELGVHVRDHEGILDELRASVVELRSENAERKSEAAEHKNEVARLKNEVEALKNDVVRLERDALKKEVEELRKRDD